MNVKGVVIVIAFMLLFALPVNTTYFEKVRGNNFEESLNNGRTLYVGGDGPNNYTKIQDAINDANDGDTVFVYSGIYYENIVVDKSITLIGEDKETTIIDGSNRGHVVEITADGVTIQEFGIRNSDYFYAGVKIYYAGDVTIYNCNISNNYIGIELWYSSNNEIYNCNLSNNHGGMWLYHSYNNSIYNCNLSNNDDGIGLDDSGNNEIYNCNIISNNDEGIWLDASGNNEIYNCNIISNNYIGIELQYSYNNSIYNCNISNNLFGIMLGCSNNNEIYNCNIISNNDDGINVDEYIICAYKSSNNEIHYNNIYDNVDYGIYNSNSDPEYVVDASHNYWGSSDGPGGVGSGDNVSQNVIYQPWLASPWGEENPSLYVHPTFHDFGNMDVGEEADWNFYIENTGGGTLSWSVSESLSWISVGPMRGDTTTEVDTVTVHIDTTGLEAGKHYDGYIHITSNGGDEDVYIELDTPPPNHPPVVEIIYPIDGAIIDGSVTIQGTASDEDGNETIQKIEVKIDNREWITATGTISWSCEWDTTQVENGQHTIYVRVYDGKDYGDIVSISVNVFNNHKPFIEITEPENGGVIKGSIIIKGKAWDVDGNETLQKVEIRIDRGDWKEATGTVNWTYSLDTTKLSNGEHIIEARSRDSVSYSDIAKITINVQNEEEREVPWFVIGVTIAIIIVAIATAWYMKKK